MVNVFYSSLEPLYDSGALMLLKSGPANEGAISTTGVLAPTSCKSAKSSKREAANLFRQLKHIGTGSFAPPCLPCSTISLDGKGVQLPSFSPPSLIPIRIPLFHFLEIRILYLRKQPRRIKGIQKNFAYFFSFTQSYTRQRL